MYFSFPGTTYLTTQNQDRKRNEVKIIVEYLLSDGHGSYIRQDAFSGKYVPVRNLCLADKWEQRVKAQNILKNGLCKKDRKRFHVIEIDDGNGISDIKKDVTVSEMNTEENDLHIDKVKELSENLKEDCQMEKWKSGINYMKDFVLDAEVRKEELNKEMSDIDKEISDIQHYIELNNLNAYQGFLAYKMLQGRLRKRRKIKNELHVLSQLGACKVDSSMLADIQNAIKELDSRTYTPRILSELFE